MWAERDITAVLRTRIKTDQTLEIDTTHAIDTGDPWFGVHKVISIIYSYEGQPLNLLVTRDGAGIFSIYPGRIEPVSFILPQVDRSLISGARGSGLQILAVVWGSMYGQRGPVPEATVTKIYAQSGLECTNKFFEFDGYPNEHKTCQVFYRMKHDLGSMACLVAREHSTISLGHL